MTYNQILLYTYIIYISLLSLITFIIYSIDKKRAIQNKYRIKEKTLLLFTTIGGSIGAALSRIIFNHKTNKYYFSIIIYFNLILNIMLLILLIKGVL